MGGPNPSRRGAGGGPPESYAKLVTNVASVLAGLGVLAYVTTTRRPAPKPVPVALAATRPASAKAPKPAAAAPVAETPAPPPAPRLDQAAVAKAEAALDAASRDRARAEARADAAARRLADASARAALDARAARTLGQRVRDPSTRVAQAAANGRFLRAERDKLKGEIATLARAPRPKAKVLSNKNPVARPADGDEHHFEVRRNRVTYIDLDRLLTMVKADAQLRIRLSDGARVVDSKVGPVGAFALEYTLARALPSGLEELMERRGVLNYDLRGWEVVPIFEGRGETYESTRQSVSDFARTINRLSPARSTVTMWVYPDGFALYRKLRDDLQTRGFLVAARPLPEGVPVRGSPGGSVSAGQ
jgi:hypothetical protein